MTEEVVLRLLHIQHLQPHGEFVKTANLPDNKIMVSVIRLILLIMTRAL